MKTIHYQKGSELCAKIICFDDGGVSLTTSIDNRPVQRFNSVQAAQAELARLCGGELPKELSEEELKQRSDEAEAAAQEEHKKRKTTTSTTVKARYNRKHYTRIPLDVPKELAQRFKDKCAAEGKAYAAVLKEAIEEYLKK